MSARWPEVPLTEVADLIRGVSYPKTDSRGDPGPGYVPVLRATNIQDARLVLESDLVYVAASNVSPDQRLRPGDIVIATSSGSKHLVGKSALLRGTWDGSFGAFCAGIRPKANIEPRYLAYFLQSPRYWKDIGKKALGVNINNLRRGDLETLLLPLPSVAEQRELVGEVEMQFSRLDEAIAYLERVTVTLSRYRDAVLAAAVDGSVIGEDPTAAVPIGSTIATLDQGWSPQCESEPASHPDEWAVIKTTAIQAMEFLAAENKRLPAALQPRPGLELRAGDLLVTRAGPRSRVGVACAVRSTMPRLMLCDKAYRMRFKAAVADARYMEIVLNAPSVRDAINQIKTGISDSGVNLTQKRFNELCVPVPLLARQLRIVAEVDRRLSIVREVEIEVEANLERAHALRQAVLARAFGS